MMRFLSILPIVSIGGLITVAIATEPSLNGATLQSASPLESTTNASQNLANQKSATVPDFLVLGGGGAPSYNEIAIEKNVLYFQRTLKTLGFDPSQATILFANGNDGRETVRYLDANRLEQFKAPKIPYLKAAATVDNLQQSLRQIASASASDRRPLFFYFTGHGSRNREDEDNNTMLLWNDRRLSVRQFATFLERLPPTKPVVTVMVQCYAGAFANSIIYKNGDPQAKIADRHRCGFFATTKYLPSVGCTPEVNEADYRDYSSSFFAGLSGTNRIGQRVASADYNQDGRVSYLEAHAFAKVDEQAADLPISTSESWLQSQLSEAATANLLSEQSLSKLLATARPEQRFVVQSLAKQLNFDRNKSYTDNEARIDRSIMEDELKSTYLARLKMELINIAIEQQLRTSKNTQKIAILDRLLNCESGSLGKS
ncbi:caspase family protein [Chamaesiphon sp. VAR_48_metabat_403]|uniref:caspase family protein n=1 Tax=Chamaesiphon sp. VAR_48_metabat_403 TaxID=2964700 RepID=UPI00286DC130|nr:caspase family protein [Chamaesiphon sp. VAR_48_metabat_403]